MKETRLKFLLLPLIAVVSVALVSVAALSATLTSPAGTFTVTHNSVALNHTTSFNTSVVVVAAGAGDGVVLDVLNSSTNITNSYSQPLLNSFCGSDSNGLKPAINNGTGVFSTLYLGSGASATVSLFLGASQLTCSPGRWFGGPVIRNQSNTSEAVSFNVTIDIPITSSTAAFNLSSAGVSIYNGTIPINATEGHVYYVNASPFVNATTMLVNLSSVADLDVFLFDGSGNLADRDTDDETGKSAISTSPTNSFWQLKVYGNTTSSSVYSGTVLFSTLNVSNWTATSLNYATMNSGSSNSTTLNFSNVGYLVQQGVVESAQVAFVRSFPPVNGNPAATPTSFEQLVPSSASKLRFTLNWFNHSGNNVANYTLTLLSPDGTVYATSLNQHTQAKLAGASPEAFIEAASPTNGIWKLNVTNATTQSVTNYAYSVTAKVFFNPSTWLTSNFSSLANNTFDVIGTEGSVNRSVSATLAVPNTALDGSYQAELRYTSSAGAMEVLPVSFTATTGTIVVNRTLNSSTLTVVDNAGRNYTKSVMIAFNNTGSAPVEFNVSNSSYVLRHVSNGSRTVPFTVSIISSPIAARANTTINVSLTYNTSLTDSVEGIYQGWIYIDAPTATPAQGHNLTLRADLRDDIIIAVSSLASNTTGDHNKTNSTAAEDFRVDFQMRYANNTPISDGEGQLFNLTNFTIYLTNANATDFRVPSSGGLAIQNTTPLPNLPDGGFYVSASDIFRIRATVPANTPGGFYTLSVDGDHHLQPLTFSGTGSFQHLIINNYSAQMSSNATGCSLWQASCTATTINIDDDENTTFTAFVRNIGTLTSVPITLNFTESCSSYSVTALVSNCTGGGASGQRWTVSPNVWETCYVSWRITGVNSSASCSGEITGAPSEVWIDSTGITVPVDVDEPGSSSDDDSSSASSSTTTTATPATTTTSTSSPTYLSITKWNTVIEITQGQEKTYEVSVKNTNNTLTQSVELSVTGLDSRVTTSVSPDSSSISAGGTTDFQVTFSVPEGVEVDNYPGKFEASSSQATVATDFNLHVLPGAAAMAVIEANFSSIKDEVLALWLEINQTANSGVNVSASNLLFAQLKSKLDEAEASLALGTSAGHFAASQIFEEMQSLLATTRSQLKVDKQGSSSFVWPVDPLYIGIGIGIAAVGFLVYLFLPTKGGIGGLKDKLKLKIGDKPQGPGAKFAGLKEKIKGHAENVSDAAGTAKDKISEGAGATKDKTSEQFKKLQEKFRLKRAYKYKYEE